MRVLKCYSFPPECCGPLTGGDCPTGGVVVGAASHKSGIGMSFFCAHCMKSFAYASANFQFYLIAPARVQIGQSGEMEVGIQGTNNQPNKN